MKKILIIIIGLSIYSCGNKTKGIDGDNKDQGYLTIQDQFKYIGEITNGKPHGRGTLKNLKILDKETLKLIEEGKLKEDYLIKYVGDWKNGIRDGYGKEWYQDGTMWEGIFKNNQLCMDCDGLVRFTNYFKGYISQYRIENNKEVEGSQITIPISPSNMYLGEGVCEGDCDFGYGVMKYNGDSILGESIYKGNFNNCERNGYGEFTNSSGNYIGEFKNNLFHGQGKYTWNNGDIFNGEFKEGLENGFGKKIYPYGIIDEGIWENGILITNTNNVVKEYHENGQLRSETNYKDGKEEGLCNIYHENGQLMFEIYYENGKKEGLDRWYYRNGQLRSDGNCKDDEREGLWKWYNVDGKLRTETNYKDGERISEKCFDENGNETDC